METPEKKTFLATYNWAKGWQDLPWAHEEATLFLAEIVRRRPPGRALDMGCGAGTDSVFLARHGWEVTALDFMPKALEYTAERARAAGVTVRPVEADITEWVADGPYDLVLDHGLLHNMDPVRHEAYRARVLAALAADGEFVLLHWHPLHAGQANGRMGPHRADRDRIRDFFAPELQERYFAREEFEDLPDIVGGGMVQAYYWFRRNRAVCEPQALLAQLRTTLERHGIDHEAKLGGLGDEALTPALPDALLARVIGPGRLGIHHREPDPAALPGVLAKWASSAGLSAVAARNLLTLFALDEHGGLCVAGAPRCEVCAVRICKRLRDR